MPPAIISPKPINKENTGGCVPLPARQQARALTRQRRAHLLFSAAPGSRAHGTQRARSPEFTPLHPLEGAAVVPIQNHQPLALLLLAAGSASHRPMGGPHAVPAPHTLPT